MRKGAKTVGGSAFTTGNSVLSFVVSEEETTLLLNGIEITNVSNPEMAALLAHVLSQIRMIIGGHEDILAIDKQFQSIEGKDNSIGGKDNG